MIDLRSISRRALLVATSSSTFALLQSRFAHAQDLASDAANRAVEISQLEADRDFDAIYDLMHPDAQAIIPREVVVGWYRDELSDRDAGVLTVLDVFIHSWQWDVTGKVYGAAAEVTFKQPFFVSGTALKVAETMQLVDPGDGRGPRWFFGRSREFVDEQIARYTGDVAVEQAGTGEYTITELGVLPGFDFSSADAINNAGLVAGTCFLRADPGFAGFAWEDGILQSLADRTGKPFSINFPSDVNSHGVIVGGSAEFEGAYTAFSIDGPQFQDIGTIDNYPSAVADAINDDGVIVGWCQGQMLGSSRGEPARAVRWGGDGIARLDDENAHESHARGINNGSGIVGDATWDEMSQAVAWLDDALTKLPRYSPKFPIDSAVAINAAGTIVGVSQNEVFFSESWTWRPGEAQGTALARPEKTPLVEARAINEAGLIVGVAGDINGIASGLLWRNGVCEFLTDLLPPNSGWRVFGANDINDRGEIAVTLTPIDGKNERFAAILRPR